MLQAAAREERGAQVRLLFLWADEHRAPAMGAYGTRTIRTPTLYRLAETGSLFEHAYCAFDKSEWALPRFVG